MNDVIKEVGELFRKYKDDKDNNDIIEETRFFKHLYKICMKYHIPAFDVIEKNIFEQPSNVRTVWYAVYFCAHVDFTSATNKRINVLKHVLNDHDSALVRSFAANALRDMGMIQHLRDAYENESDLACKRKISHHVIEADIKNLIAYENHGIDASELVGNIFAPIESTINKIYENFILKYGNDKFYGVLNMIINSECVSDDIVARVKDLQKTYGGGRV